VKAAVVRDVGVVEVVSVADPTPESGEVVVEVAACGLCGTDLHIRAGEFAPALPIIPGHEFAGTVVALGGGVDRVRVGDRVAVDPSLYCFKCPRCRTGRNNLCESWGAIGVSRAGGAAEYVAVPAANCVRVPDGFPLVAAALVEPLSCAVHAFDVLSARVGARVLIYGAGTMGLMLARLAVRSGAVEVSLVDVNEAKLATARRLGDVAVAPRADELPGDGTWHVVIDATGNSAAIQDGLGRVAAGGTYLQFGVASPDVRVWIDPFRVYNQEITITGSMAVLHSFERAADLLAGGVLDPDLFITDRFALASYANALDHFAAGKGVKTVVLPGWDSF
jgi:2-desacetyl-2-hydroxyethyl bacteriochlorophyllide A dehydrogenase